MIEALQLRQCTDARAWCEANIELPASTSPNSPGPLSLGRQPWMAEILGCFLDPNIEDLYLCMGTQTGKTTACLLGMALLMEFDPAPMIWALPTEPLASRLAKTRILPLLHVNTCLQRHVRRADDISPGLMLLDNMQIFCMGATSPSKISSQPCAYVILDEEAKIEHPKRTEAHPVLLLSERTKSFARHLRVHASTPNTENNIFWRGLQETDVRKFFCPCPHCGQFQTLEFARDTIVWDTGLDDSATPDQIRATAYYVCKVCGEPIYETDRLPMLERGEWRPTRPGASSSRRGYHINSLYSPFVGFGDFALAFWQARSNGLGSLSYQNWVNSWKSEPYSAYVLRVDDNQIPRLCDTYRARTIPIPADEYHYIFVGYDPGDSVTHWVATLIAQGGEMYIIDWGTISSVETDRTRGIVGISEHIESLIWDGVRPDLGYVDSGDRAQTVYAECDRAPHLLSPSKGQAATYGTWREAPLKSNPLLNLITYSDYQAKYELYAQIIAKNDLSSLHLPSDASPELIRGLSGQTLEILPSGRRQWKNVKGDHYGDCVKLARVSWWVNRSSIEPPEPFDNQTTDI